MTESTPGAPLRSGDGTVRRAQLRESLLRVQRAIITECARVDRDPAEVHLVVATKFFPASDVLLLAELGVTNVAESRAQELRAKYLELEPAAQHLRWHFIGQLQTNKAGVAARYADVIQSVDRADLVAALARQARDHVTAGHELPCLIQVSADAAVHRGGVLPDQVPQLAQLIAAAPGLRVAGVMAVAPTLVDPTPFFRQVVQVASQLRQNYPHADMCSLGMSGDYQQAIAAGATHLRLGSAILGNRPPFR